MSTTQPPAPNALTRQLRLFKILASVLGLCLILGIGYFFYERHLGQPVQILVNGKPIATVRNAATANALLEDVEQAKIGGAFADSEPVRLTKTVLQRAPDNAPLDTDAAVRARLLPLLKFHIHAYVILVRGHPSVALPSADAATETLELVKQHFAKMPPDNELLEPPQIVENTLIARRAVDVARARAAPDIAAPYFWTPPPSRQYTVRRGDTGAGIAYRSHMSLTDLLVANPGKNLNKLTPGDVVNVQKMPLLLTVRVKKKFTREEKIVAQAPDDDAGKRSITYVVTYTNGQETRRDVQDIAILEKPRVRTEL